MTEMYKEAYERMRRSMTTAMGRLANRELELLHCEDGDYLVKYEKITDEAGQPVVAPAFSEIKVEGNKVFTKPGKFATFYEAMHDLVNRWESEHWTAPTFKFMLHELMAEWY